VFKTLITIKNQNARTPKAVKKAIVNPTFTHNSPKVHPKFTHSSAIVQS